MQDIITLNGTLTVNDDNNITLKEKSINYDYFLSVIDSLLNEYYHNLDLKDKTIKSYNDSIKCFMEWLKTNQQPICKSTMLDFKKYLSNNLKPRTINLYLSGLRQFFNFLEELGLPNVMKNIKNITVGEGHSKNALTIEQFITIDNNMQQEIKELKEQYINNQIKKEKYLLILRDYAIFNISVRNLLREIELNRADKMDIQNKQNQNILMIQGKGHDSKDDFTVLTDDTYKILDDYLKVRGKDNYSALFISISSNCYGTRLSTRSLSKVLKNIFKKYGNIDSPLITGHSTRHTGATFSYKEEKDILKTKELARHKNIQTTAIYTHLEDRLQNPTENIIQNYIRKERLRLEQ